MRWWAITAGTNRPPTPLNRWLEVCPAALCFELLVAVGSVRGTSLSAIDAPCGRGLVTRCQTGRGDLRAIRRARGSSESRAVQHVSFYV